MRKLALWGLGGREKILAAGRRELPSGRGVHLWNMLGNKEAKKKISHEGTKDSKNTKEHANKAATLRGGAGG